MEWEGMEWEGMEWEGMGWDRTGWVNRTEWKGMNVIR